MANTVPDIMEQIKRAIDAMPKKSPALIAADLAAEKRWAGRWRMVHQGIIFKVVAVRDGNVIIHRDGLHEPVSTAVVIKIGDMDFLTQAGELQFLGRV